MATKQQVARMKADEANQRFLDGVRAQAVERSVARHFHVGIPDAPRSVQHMAATRKEAAILKHRLCFGAPALRRFVTVAPCDERACGTVLPLLTAR